MNRAINIILACAMSLNAAAQDILPYKNPSLPDGDKGGRSDQTHDY